MISLPEILALAIAFVLGGAIAWAWRRLLPERAPNFTAPVAIASAYAVGYLLLAYQDALPPSRHYHWPPYLALATAIVGPLVLSPRVPVAARWALYALATFTCAYFLTPMWPSLWPTRSVCIPVLATYLLVVALAIQPLATRIPSTTLLAAMTLSLAALATLILAMVSLIFGMFAMLAAAAFAGVWVLAGRSAQPVPLAGLALTYALLAGAWAFIGCIEPRPAEWGLLIAPFATVALWAATIGPMAKLRGKTAVLAPIALVMSVLGVAAIAIAT